MNKEEFIRQISVVQEPLRRFLYGLCDGDMPKADDIAQDAILKAYLSFNQYEGRSKFSTWLFRIAYNCFFDSMKKAEKHSYDSIDDMVINPIDDSTRSDRHFDNEQLYIAIENLSPTEKAVTLLFYMEDKSISEISQISDMPQGTVKSHLNRARKHLKNFLAQKTI